MDREFSELQKKEQLELLYYMIKDVQEGLKFLGTEIIKINKKFYKEQE